MIAGKLDSFPSLLPFPAVHETYLARPHVVCLPTYAVRAGSGDAPGWQAKDHAGKEPLDSRRTMFEAVGRAVVVDENNSTAVKYFRQRKQRFMFISLLESRPKGG